jgi:hypothetical protein
LWASDPLADDLDTRASGIVGLHPLAAFPYEPVRFRTVGVSGGPCLYDDSTTGRIRGNQFLTELALIHLVSKGGNPGGLLKARVEMVEGCSVYTSNKKTGAVVEERARKIGDKRRWSSTSARIGRRPHPHEVSRVRRLSVMLRGRDRAVKARR